MSEMTKASIEIKEAEYKSLVLDSKGVVVVKFSRDNCGYCVQVASTYEEVAATLPDIRFYTIHNAIILLMSIVQADTVPATLIYKDGVLFDRIRGTYPVGVLTRHIEDVIKADAPLPVPVPQSRDINTLPTVEIKAMVYDEMVIVEKAQLNIRSLNQILQQRNGNVTK